MAGGSAAEEIIRIVWRFFMRGYLKEESYKDYRDEELVRIAQAGDDAVQDYLLDKYKSLVRAKSRAYFLIGADSEDIIQEGMIGLYKAVRDFNGEKNTSFRSFAELCVNRQMITAIKAATRQKHQPLNSYISLNKPVYEDETEQTYMDLLQEGAFLNPETLLIGQENRNFLEDQLVKHLSGFETRVLMLYLQGRSYFEIARTLKKPEKSIDNALQRIKKKLERFLEEKDVDGMEKI
jgi:RNA polymerase sporulation-specific sigma factor